MKPILTGQYFLEFVDEQKTKSIGWTVVFVESGEWRSHDGTAHHGLAKVVVVRNDTRGTTPITRKYNEIEELINSANWIVTSAPMKKRVIVPDEPPARASGLFKAERKRIKIRQTLLNEKDRRMEIIRPLVDLGRDLYAEKTRMSLLNKIAAAHKLSPECVRQYLSLWWQFGCSPDGLLPRHSLAGQKSLNARRALSESAPAEYPYIAYKTGPKPSAESDPGILMGPAEIEKCRKGARDFLFKPSPDHKFHLNWISAWTQTKNRYFDRRISPTSPAPSIKQFRGAVSTDPEFEHLSVKIIGALPFLRNNRQMTSSSRSGILGPGQLGQLDDVTSKVILVDELTKRPLGTCRVFVLVDTWSHIVAGAHDTLEGSNFEEAKQCLLNAFLDKKDFREAHGLTYNPKFVPCAGVFRTLVTDGGPLGGDLPNDLPEEICHVDNTAHYRPDLKSDVETSFHAYLLQVARELPGYNRQKRCRGDDDPKILAYLTPIEFRRIFWDWIALYNCRKLMGWLPAEAMGVENPPDPSPYALWNWGIVHCGGALRERTPEDLYRALLARGEGTLTARRGLNFKGLIYLLESRDNLTAGLFCSEPVRIFYDTKYTRRVFVELDGVLVVAKLRSDHDQMFGHLSFKGVEFNKHRLDARGRDVLRKHATTREAVFARITEIKKNAPKGTRKQRKRAATAVSVDATRRKQQAIEDKRRSDKAEITLFAQTLPTPTTPKEGRSSNELTKPVLRQLTILDFLT